MRDIKYIIKRIIIGTGIALAVMFMKQNVFAYEWETSNDSQIDLSSYTSTLRVCYSISTGSVSFPVVTNRNLCENAISSTDVESGSASFNTTTNFIDFGNNATPYIYNSFSISLGDYPFQADTYYKLIFPIAYDSNSELFYNDSKLDESVYTFSDDRFSVYSAGFSKDTINENPLCGSGNYNSCSYAPYLSYFYIIFSGSVNLDNLILYINGSTNSSYSHTLPSFNTISDTNYILKGFQRCSYYSNNSSCSPYFNKRWYKPFLYTTAVGPDYIIDDGNDVASSVSSDIKTQINDIINGQFSEDLDFPYLNGGGRSFGDNEYTMQDLLIMPLNFIQKLTTTDTCTPLTVPVPGLSGTMQFPCISTFMSSILGQQIVDMIKLIVGCILGFKILTALYNSVLHIFSPDHLLWVDDIF